MHARSAQRTSTVEQVAHVTALLLCRGEVEVDACVCHGLLVGIEVPGVGCCLCSSQNCQRLHGSCLQLEFRCSPAADPMVGDRLPVNIEASAKSITAARLIVCRRSFLEALEDRPRPNSTASCRSGHGSHMNLHVHAGPSTQPMLPLLLALLLCTARWIDMMSVDVCCLKQAAPVVCVKLGVSRWVGEVRESMVLSPASKACW